MGTWNLVFGVQLLIVPLKTGGQSLTLSEGALNCVALLVESWRKCSCWGGFKECESQSPVFEACQQVYVPDSIWVHSA